MKFVVIPLMVMMLGGCSSKRPSLKHSTWTLVSYTDSSGMNTLVTYPHGKKDSGYWVGFDTDAIFGSDNCNQFSGTYTVSDTTIRTADLLSTLIGCPDNIPMIAALHSASTFSLTDSRLRLSTGHPQLQVLLFEKL